MQYGSTWTTPAEAAPHLKDISELYAVMRPFVSGASYVNYCDLELPEWASAYWGTNLSRLKQIKGNFDPNNVFRHALSIPLP
jgi:Berberine and berberine like